MPWGIGKGESGDAEISQGQEFQCDCSIRGCSCSAWGHWVPSGRPVPSEVRCTQCLRGNHPN